MVDLAPTPASLGLASPALGPWFNTLDTDPLPTLGLPAADLSVAVSLPVNMEWRAPAGCIVSYFIATGLRPVGLSTLRQENGSSAFTTGELVVLLTLLPEAELRLHALTSAIPSPNGSLTAAGVPTRPRVRYLAMAFAAGSVPDVATLERLRENPVTAVSSDADKAAFLGLTLNGGNFGNADKPTTELCRPAKDSAIVLKNRTVATLGTSLWAFDYRGRAVDPGAVATWWSHLASPNIFDNLWADDDPTMQRTAAAAPANLAHLVSAHEGPLASELLARLNRTGLTQTSGSSALFTVGTTASISLTTAPDPDNAPLPRIAMLPDGNYASPAVAGATLFSAWNSTTSPWPTTLARDYVKIAVMDIENHLVGLDRTDAAQALSRTRVGAFRNSSATPFLAQTDAASQQTLTLLNGTGSQAMAPVMDARWGALSSNSLGSADLPDSLVFSVKALRGEGETDGGTAAEQKVVLHFADGALPAGAWIRCWPHGLDTTTGTRFRQDGGGALADPAGQAFVVMAIPDGTAASTDPAAAPVRLSFDALIVSDIDSRYYIEQRYSRPAVIPGSRITLPATPGVPPATTLWVSEQALPMTRSAGLYASGQTLLGLPDDLASGEFALVDLASLDPTDIAASTLLNATDATDRLIVTKPAFANTAEGDVTTSPGPGGATVIHRDRSGLSEIDTFGRPAPLMERREVVSVNVTNAAGVVAATPARASLHESPPAQLGHPGMPASAELHGSGVALAGQAITPLITLMQERAATSLGDFVSAAQQPLTPVADSGGTTAFATVLETLTFGVTGDAAIRAFVAASPTHTPGQDWIDLKTAIEGATGFDFDPLIDSTTFDDETLAAAIDRVILKTRDGAMQAATAIQAAIARAEDFVYIETPAIDPLTAGTGSAIDIVGAITARWADRPALKVVLCVPEKFLPGQPAKLDSIRVAGVAAALKSLRESNPANIELFTPVAGSGRRLHMAATTIIVDDVIAITGSTHLWRRGLSFDSALSVALFDENVTDGRASAVRSARQQLFVERLGLAAGLAPDDPADMLDAVRQLNAAGGLQRVKPGAYPAADDTTSEADRNIWNPDGRPGGVSDWFLFFGGLVGDVAEEVNNAIR